MGVLSANTSGGFDLALADGGILPVMVTPGSGGGGTGTVTNVSAAAQSALVVTNPTTTPVISLQPFFTQPELLFQNIASLIAYNVAAPVGLAQGAQAFVQSNGSVWTLMLATLTPDGITVVNATGVAGAQWVRENIAGYLPQALVQTAWFVDPAAGNDEATGLTSGTAVKTKKEIYRRWGYTWSPTFDGINVVITYVTADTTAGHDPGRFAPILVNGARFLQTAALPATSFTGTLLAVTAKNRSTNTPLSSTFTTATGAMAANLLLVNTTRGNSRAFAQRNLGGGNWRISQPFAANADPTIPSGVEVDTWANGDAILGYALLHVDIAAVDGRLTEFAADGGFGHCVSQLWIIDPPGIQDTIEVAGACYPLFIDCVCERTLSITGGGTYGRAYNTQFIDNIPFRTGSPGFGFLGGTIGGTAAPPGNNSSLYAGYVESDTLIVQPGMWFINCQFAVGVALDFAGSIQFVGDTDCQSAVVAFYGTGIINSRSGSVRYGAAAAGTFITSGGLAVDGVATAYSLVTAAGVTTMHGGITLTAAHLDAAAGAAGFGGYAFGGGGAFVQSGAQP